MPTKIDDKSGTRASSLLVTKTADKTTTSSGGNSTPTLIPTLLSPKDAARVLRLSVSWLAKARMSGDGPPYHKIGRAVRYTEPALMQWMRSRMRLSTSEQ